MILVDFSQTVLGACYSFSAELSTANPDKEGAKAIVRHVILSQVKYWKKRFGEDYGDLVISCDGRNYWRKKLFPQYKASRKKAREHSSMDWQTIYEVMDEMTVSLKENFNYKVIKVDGAESDDVIATLVRHTRETSKDPIIIVSSDHDFCQLQKYENVDQIGTKDKDFIKVDDPAYALKEKIIRGDRGDGIPSILNEDNIYLEVGRRATPMTRKRFDNFINSDPAMLEDAIIRRNWKRNQTLIDFDCIPEKIQTAIIDEFAKPTRGSKGKILKYLQDNMCIELIHDIDSF